LKKKVLVLIIIIAIAIIAAAIVLMVPWGPSEPKLEISSVYDVTEGQTFLVNITVTDVNDLFKWVINIQWDPEIIKITTGDTNGLAQSIFGVITYYNIYEGPFLKSVRETRVLFTLMDNTNGKIQALTSGYATAGTSTASGSGVLATINFTCTVPGTTNINITGSMLLDHTLTEMLHKTKNGLVTDQSSGAAASMVTFIISTCCNHYQSKACMASNKREGL
jgi:hypothetical protein